MPQEDFDNLLVHVKDHFKNSKKYPPERVRKELIKNRTGVAPANNNDSDNNPNPASVNHSPDNRSMSNISQLSDDDDSYDSDDLDEVSEGDMALPSDMYSRKDDYSSVDPLLHAEVDGRIMRSTKKVTKMPPAVPNLIAPQVDERTMKSIPSVSKRPAEVFDLCGTEVDDIEDTYEGLLSSSFQQITLCSQKTTIRSPYMLKHETDPWYVVMFEIPGGVLDRKAHIFDFSERGDLLIYLNLIDDVHLDAETMLQDRKIEQYQLHEMNISRELISRKSKRLGSVQEIDGKFWKVVHKFPLPTRVERQLFNVMNEKVDFPQTHTNGYGSFLCIFKLKERPRTPLPVKAPVQGNFFIPPCLIKTMGDAADDGAVIMQEEKTVIGDKSLYEEITVYEDKTIGGDKSIYEEITVYGDKTVGGDKSMYEEITVYDDKTIGGDKSIYTEMTVHDDRTVYKKKHASQDTFLLGNKRTF